MPTRPRGVERRDEVIFVRFRVSVEHRETFIVDASCAAEAQFTAADFAVNHGDSEYADHILEHAEETLQYTCTQLEACQHTPLLAEDQLDA
jgi:hypothetical protein